jgi:hypothetical protein
MVGQLNIPMKIFSHLKQKEIIFSQIKFTEKNNYIFQCAIYINHKKQENIIQIGLWKIIFENFLSK